MTPVVILVILLVVAGMFFFLGDRVFKHGRNEQLNERLRALAIEHEPVEEVVADTRSFGQRFREDFQGTLGRRLERSDKSTVLADQLIRADLRLRSSEWIVIRSVVGVLLGALLWLQLGSPVAAPIGFIAAQIGCRFFLRFRQNRRRAKFDKQLAEVITALANWIKAGQSFPQAMDAVARNAPMPARLEFQRFGREVALGVPIDDALAHLVERNQSDDLDLLVVAVQLQRATGGNLAEILNGIAYAIRERVRIRGQIKTITAPGRMQGYIITGLPFVLGVGLNFLNPTYFHRMFTTTLGQVFIGIVLFMIGAGYAIIRKIVNVKI